MSEQIVRAPVSSDERIAAALAHALIIVQTLGILGAAVIWLLQKDKSPYVARHALQAIAYQFVGTLLWFGLLILYGLYGAYVALQGREFRYVIIGPLVERLLGSQR